MGNYAVNKIPLYVKQGIPELLGVNPGVSDMPTWWEYWPCPWKGTGRPPSRKVINIVRA